MTEESLLTADDWNIVLLTSDEHNAKLMGCAGHSQIRTPALDRLAGEGTLFTKAYCAYPLCAPTRQSLITGKYPTEHGQIGNSYVFDKRNETWAHHFKKHGYTTACVGKMHTNHEEYEYGYDYRYSRVDIPEEIEQKRREQPPKYDLQDERVYQAMTDNWGKKKRFSGMVASDGSWEHDGVMTDEAIRYLRRHQDEKFFLHVSLVKPHWPWDSPEEYYYMYDPETIDLPQAVPGELEQNYIAWKRYVGFGWNHNTEAQHRLCRARYYGSISWLDSNIGKILDTLDELDLTRRTLVIYSSDHGDMAGEKGLWLKSLMYDSSARVPLIVRMPGVVPAGRINDLLINHVDLFPTLAGLVGAADDLPETTGRNYANGVLGAPADSEYTFTVEGLSPDWGVLPLQLMARSSRWKLIQYNVEDTNQRFVLYDMENDPRETANLANDEAYSDVVREHREAMDRFWSGLVKPRFELINK